MKRCKSSDLNPASLKLKKDNLDYNEILKDKMENGSEEEILHLINYVSLTQLLTVKDDKHESNVFYGLFHVGSKKL
ncbi:hypothetical protein I862_07470 [endosymbiont of Acanthamoeba sp. UWC8]|uniref:hypothetical protein n=1 Tax=endosymbiont of Acanthamoeba sp. UWC8 TaxID=86106 RepID=UPI0004D1A84C|nr:hypothetical protein [endosymbiont of Acanthamoeba sp. UWC8]AIF82048.1 hypothetical protein I862_07470 [endosymbiont of Acanthamoeba sp. UWC8]